VAEFEREHFVGLTLARRWRARMNGEPDTSARPTSAACTGCFALEPVEARAERAALARAQRAGPGTRADHGGARHALAAVARAGGGGPRGRERRDGARAVDARRSRARSILILLGPDPRCLDGFGAIAARSRRLPRARGRARRAEQAQLRERSRVRLRRLPARAASTGSRCLT
jgi:hypothetical protein